MCYDPIRCIIPPFMLKRIAESVGGEYRKSLLQDVLQSKKVREARAAIRPPAKMRVALAARMAAPQLPRKQRMIYNAKHGRSLPGVLVRAEGQRTRLDRAVNEAYNYSGYTFDFFWSVLKRNSIDGAGMPIVSTVHYWDDYDNAYWDGTQMVYGDGDGQVFRRFTASLDIVAHELTHGVISYTCDLNYKNQPGALNEHFADVFGVLVKHWRKDWTAKQADAKDGWLIGKEIVIRTRTRRALRSMSAPGTAYDDALLGKDDQPSHMRNYYTGREDDGGVHINSGIPNHAFYLASMNIGGKAWLRAGRIWYEAMLALKKTSDFAHCREETLAAAERLFGKGSKEHKAVRSSWTAVGV